MAGTAVFAEVAHVKLPANPKSSSIPKNSSEGIVQHADPERNTSDVSSSAFKLPESVRSVGRAASAALSVPPWLQERLGFLAPQNTLVLSPVAWHRYKDRLAMADVGDRVHICDASAVASTSGRLAPSAALPANLALYHDFQQQVSALAWRPLSGNTLAVGCRRGVCLWSLGKCPAGGAPACRATVAGSSTSAWLTFLRTRGEGPVTALAWSPNGQLLAASSQDASGFVIVDVTTGMQTSVQAGLAAVSLLDWSPDGSYLLAGGADGSFRIWETQKWTSAAWSTQGNAQPLAGAAWAPDGRAVVVAHRGDRQLAALYLTRPAPALDSQLFPLALPCPAPGGEAGPRAAAFAWDAEGERLAVALEPSEPGSTGRIAIFATSYKPILAMRLLGFAAEKPGHPAATAPTENGPSDGASKGHPAGHTSKEGTPVLAFHKGSLLAVQQGTAVPTSLYACSQYIP
ncbi:hypothetical protein WJX75_006010 [Coccomyxa subellipsoidea]|uniref:WD40 repeat-like protein n=1 Tax=Coccomyxa subellipsoidea TaxID=248742 RepID=A0ABR2YYE8_9CHLO